MDNNDKCLISTDSLYGILDSIKDLSASDEIESYLTGGIIDVISPLLTYYQWIGNYNLSMLCKFNNKCKIT